MTTNQVYQRATEEHNSPLLLGSPRALCRRVCNRTNSHGQIQREWLHRGMRRRRGYSLRPQRRNDL